MQVYTKNFGMVYARIRVLFVDGRNIYGAASGVKVEVAKKSDSVKGGMKCWWGAAFKVALWR